MQTTKDKSLEALRRIILEEDEKKLMRLEEELSNLKIQIADKEALLDSLEPVIADLLERKIISSRDEMAEALAPIMGEAIKRQVSEAKEDVVDALYPVIGKAIRKSVAEAMKKLVESANQKIDQTLRRRLFAKRIQSKITGVPEGELILKDTLPFHIEEIFLIHKASGLLIAYVSSSQAETTVDEELIGGMLTAIRDFVAEAFKTEQKQDLNEIQYGDSRIILEMGRYSYLAVVVSGVIPGDFKDHLQKLDRRIHNRYFKQLRQFNGDMTELGEIAKPLQRYLKTHNLEREPAIPQKQRPYLLYFLSFVLLAVLLVISAFKLTDYLNHRKIINAAEERFETASQLRQQDLKVDLKEGWLIVTGSVDSSHQVALIDSLLHPIKGIEGVHNRVILKMPQALNTRILEQIQQKMSQSKNLNHLKPRFIFDGDQVIIEGEVADLKAKRDLGFLVSEIPGVRIVTNNLKILDEKEISIGQDRDFLKEQTIYFGKNEVIISEEQFDKLQAVLEFIETRNNAKLVIKGYSDNSDDFDYNLKLSEQRAQTVATYLMSKKLPANDIIIEFFGEENPIASNETEAGRAENRRVEFDIIPKR